jgi:hypothetical protein
VPTQSLDCHQDSILGWVNASGRVERFVDLPIDQYTVLVEGQGAIMGKP